MTSSSPVHLSSCGEAQRCYQVGTALSRLLDLPLGLLEDDDQFHETLMRIMDLRNTVHKADLDRCSSEARMAALQFAFDNDIRLRSADTWTWTESKRQAWWNDINERLKAGQFDGFEFDKASFNAFWSAEKDRRRENVLESASELATLEAQCEERLQGWLGQCGGELTPDVWSALDASSEAGARADALAMNGPSSVWFVTEMQNPLQHEVQGRDLLLLVDLSGSMADAIELLKEVLMDIVHQATQEDRISILGFSTTTTVYIEWRQAGTEEACEEFKGCIKRMRASGGTNLVPAMSMVEDQLKTLDALPVDSPCSRRVAVVMLSDGDPEEPAESVQQATGQALRASIGRPDVAMVTLSLGDRSNPAMMAMAAQCGGGVSLYIPSNDHMAEQLGRMWGYLNALGARRETMVILQPIGGAVITDAERPLGGVVSLQDSSGSQVVVLRCGASLVGNEQRFAAQLQLPEWAGNQLDAHMLQQPLVRATWLWREGPHNALKTSHAELRVIGVPSLFIEAQLGVPVRVVLDSEEDLGEFDSERFLTSLAAALRVPRETLQLQRITKGSIIADVRFISSRAEDLASVQDACGSPTGVGCALAENGYSLIDIFTPGRSALQRGLQWRYAQALEMLGRNAEHTLPQACEMLENVQAIASSSDAVCLDASADGVAAMIRTDATAVSDALASATAGVSGAASHAMLQQAYAHCQQLCPENHPKALSVRGYEVPQIRCIADHLAQLTASRMPPVLRLEYVENAAGSQASGDATFRLHSEVPMHERLAFWFRVSTASPGQPESCLVDQKRTAQPYKADTMPTFTFGSLPQGPLQCVVAAVDGDRVGRWSEPLLFEIEISPPPVAAPSPQREQPQRNARSRRSPANSPSAARRRRSSSVSRGVRVVHAELSLPDAVHLSWVTNGASSALSGGWQVSFQPLDAQAQPSEPATTHHVSETSIWIDGLRPSTAFKFRIEAAPQAGTTRVKQRAPEADLGLSIQGRSLSLTSDAMPTPAEGVFVVPPNTNHLLAMLDGDAGLEKLQDGIYLARVPSA